MSKYIVYATTNHIDIFKSIALMFEDITSDYINIIFQKNIEESSNDENDNGDDESQEKKNNDCVIIQCINSHQTLVSKIKLNSNFFTKYRVKDNEFSFWISIEELNIYLKDIEADYSLSLYIEKENALTLMLVLADPKNSNKEIYPIGFIENDISIPDIPEIKFDFSIQISTVLFKKICSKAKQSSDILDICCSAEKVVFKYISKSNKQIIISHENDENEIKINQLRNTKVDDYTVDTSYLIDDLLCLKRTNLVSPSITLYLKKESLLFISSKIIDIGKMLIFLSPSDKSNCSNYYDKTKSVYKDSNIVTK